MLADWGRMNERRIDLKRRERFENARRLVARRLRRICADMPGLEFVRLTASMTRIRLKYESARAAFR